MHHDAGVHRDEIHHAHVGVQPGDGRVDHPALVGVDEIQRGLGLFGLLLVPGHQHPRAQRGERLHRGDPRAGRDARRHLQRQAGHPRRFDGALQPVIAPQHGVALVDVAAPEEVHLFAAVDDLPVGKIGVLLLDDRRAALLAVERQGEAVLRGQLPEVRQQPGIPPAAEDQVGVVAREQRAQVDQQRAHRLEGQAVLVLFVAQAERVGHGVVRVAVRLHVEDAQGRGLGIQLPGGIQRLDGVDPAIVIRIHPAARHRVGTRAGGEAQRKLQVGIVVGERREGLRNALEELHLRGGVGDLGGQHRHGLRQEEVAPLLARQLHPLGLLFQPAPERAQACRAAPRHRS